MKQKYSGKYDNSMIKRAISYILTREDKGEIHDGLLTVHITVSFDMGYQE